MLYSILVAVQVLISFGLVGLILMQHGKGADAGAAFGSGASGTVFGASGSANFMSRATAVLAVLFFAVSLTLAYLVSVGGTSGESVVGQLPAETAKTSSVPAQNENQQKALDSINDSSTAAVDTTAESKTEKSGGSTSQSASEIAPLPSAPEDESDSSANGATTGGGSQ